jgi:predicted metalloprotease with PDZ domain
MRTLYREFYLEKERGFTEEEFKEVSDRIAGESLEEFFEYTSTVKPVDYEKYFGYAGMEIDTEPREVSGGWLGITTRRRADSIYVSEVEYESPAWTSGIQREMIVLGLSVESEKVERIQPVLSKMKSGDKVQMKVFSSGKETDFEFNLGQKVEPTYSITVKDQQNDLQAIIFKDWSSSSN